MKAPFFLSLLLIAPLAVARQATFLAENLSDPSMLGTQDACLADCRQVFLDCQAQCENRSADAHERHFDTPDLSRDDCLHDCRVNLELCKEDC